jgi:hypothetical protein
MEEVFKRSLQAQKEADTCCQNFVHINNKFI